MITKCCAENETEGKRNRKSEHRKTKSKLCVCKLDLLLSNFDLGDPQGGDRQLLIVAYNSNFSCNHE